MNPAYVEDWLSAECARLTYKKATRVAKDLKSTKMTVKEGMMRVPVGDTCTSVTAILS
jgi:hypothetical protein